MKAISLFKLFTLVCFLMMGLNQNVLAEETKEACKARVQNTEARKEANTTCSTPKTRIIDGRPLSEPPSLIEISRCVREELQVLVDQNCSELESAKDRKNSCKDLLSKYDDVAKKTAEECSRMGEQNYSDCLNKARACSQGLSSFGSDYEDGDSISSSLSGLVGVYGRMQGASNNGANPSCVIENDDAEASKEERIDEKITRLRADIENLKEDAIKEDERLNEKRQKVEKEMQDAEREFDKVVTENKTKNQEQAGAMQRKILEAEKKKKANLVKIMNLQTQISNLAFRQQNIMIDFADSSITRACRSVSSGIREQALKAKQKFSKSESEKLKKDMKDAETMCLQKSANEKQKAIKELVDTKRQFQTEIDTFNSSNNDETKSIEADQKQIEALKVIMTESEAKELDQKNKKLAALNKSVTDLETSVANKKRSLLAKQKAKQDQIDKILMDRQNVIPKFAKVYSNTSSTTRSGRRFVSQCCESNLRSRSASSDRTTMRGYEDACVRLRSENSIVDRRPRTSPRTGR
jgi:hypothetical protein